MEKTEMKTMWAYRLKNRSWYRLGDRGSFSTAKKPYTKRELSTTNLDLMSLFDEPMDSPPYRVEFMLGGKWVKILITTTYETVKV